MKKITLMILATLMLSSCISLIRLKDTDRLLYGMTRQQVRNLLGEPLDREKEGNTEIYHYGLSPGYFSRDRYDYYVKFVDRKIVGFGHHFPADAPQ
jgi:outer membrane protein assembly factor BamE (lipoprotein component of BamABCDE complex)